MNQDEAMKIAETVADMWNVGDKWKLLYARSIIHLPADAALQAAKDLSHLDEHYPTAERLTEAIGAPTARSEAIDQWEAVSAVAGGYGDKKALNDKARAAVTAMGGFDKLSCSCAECREDFIIEYLRTGN